MDGFHITPATPADTGELLTLQYAAYITEARLYEKWDLPPLTETREQLERVIASGEVYKAVIGARAVGKIRVRPDGEVAHVGRIAVAPDLQGMGVGTRLLAAAEDFAPAGTRRMALFTGHKSVPNIRLYERLGYRETHRVPVDEQVTLVHLAKELV
ncbi:GCN5 family acetyltransferase [Actinorhabdospora filicis]|uniref:GCN5 family acetyltransferase n=1 Tax=Actinorhabdospora filicis TaxID=1785913 RepID=A0A9W6W1Q0_9ACTN|nr:GNAT family N-acetyltransferase [Actinorhabdospora filicis]GLZ76132.1 GCN5 family acetyltransferase [Actinorhabdospora filicis]